MARNFIGLTQYVSMTTVFFVEYHKIPGLASQKVDIVDLVSESARLRIDRNLPHPVCCCKPSQKLGTWSTGCVLSLVGGELHRFDSICAHGHHQFGVIRGYLCSQVTIAYSNKTPVIAVHEVSGRILTAVLPLGHARTAGCRQ